MAIVVAYGSERVNSRIFFYCAEKIAAWKVRSEHVCTFNQLSKSAWRALYIADTASITAKHLLSSPDLANIASIS